MKFNPRLIVAAAGLWGLAIVGMTAVAPPAQAAGASKYCIARGGGEGAEFSSTGSCVFNDYQACLQAAAGGGNCVPNVDYNSDSNFNGANAQSAPVARRSRHAQ